MESAAVTLGSKFLRPEGRHISAVPFIGGLLGALGLCVIPVKGVWRWFWIFLIADVACILIPFTSEVAIHFLGLAGLNKPIMWVFPQISVCLDCGAALFSVPEKELEFAHREVKAKQECRRSDVVESYSHEHIPEISDSIIERARINELQRAQTGQIAFSGLANRSHSFGAHNCGQKHRHGF